MRESKRGVVIAVVVIVLVGLAVGVGLAITFGAGSGKHTVTGVVAVKDSGAKTSNGNCVLSDTANSVGKGTKVEITDEHKTLLGTGTLGEAKQMPGNKSGGCQFTFFVTGVPSASTYNVTVGDEGSVAYTQDQLSEAGWAVSLNATP
jgi:hypothetical protein